MSTGSELTPEQIERIRQFLAKQTSSRAEVKAPDERRYFHIEWRGFDTVVPSSDSSMLEAASYALSEKLQAWYYIAPYEQKPSLTGAPTTTCWTHDQYCDWLRRKEQNDTKT